MKRALRLFSGFVVAVCVVLLYLLVLTRGAIFP
jgi:uncharacterized protein YjeT (DUF2065 family)